MNMWGKAALAALIGATVISSVSIGSSAAAVKGEIKVVLDDVPLPLGASPVIKNNVTLVPFRSIARALGIDVIWDSKTKSVRAQGEVGGVTRKVVLRTGQKKAEVDGKSVELLAAPLIVNQQVLIPLSFFGTQFGAKVGWNSAANTVTIVSQKKSMHLRAFYAMGSFAQRDKIASMDSVAFGWTRINEKGELTLEGADFNWPEAAGEVTPESLVKDTSAQGVKPYLMVYSVDGKGELTKMLSDETLRNNSIENIVRLASDNSFGGVLLDFEGLGLKLDPLGQQKLLNDYVRSLVKELAAINVKLSLAVPPPNSAYKGYDYKTLASLADDLVVMAHDYNPKGTPDHTPEPNAKVDEAISLMIKAGVPENKLILGISLWNETTATVDDKLGLAKRYGLKGASFWRLTFYSPDFANVIDRVVEKVGE
ncbi:stalk domain-containing protein [Cohnella silvisoli]|uniref:Stalk domain-containing protein n=1 Tax=Cohnella silvisoli TaxID=2873699 RepID=A0ABV1KZF3_9BACL|nr:stalk domain-containing protein [Cohnella silvisoli]MCD9021875.1 copper amine oxidase [Cohnella silvisoli]